MRASSVLLVLVLASCGGSPAPAPSAPVEPRPAEREPVDWTGGLTEAEFIALHELTTDEAPRPRGETVDLGGSRAYLSLPTDRQAPVAAVIVVHEWWGLNDHVRHWADRLAADGFAALAVDLYDGEVATDPERAMSLMRAVDEDRAIETLRSAHRFLVTDARVAAPRTGVIGWCFGGHWALRAAMAIPELDAAVMYYGRVVADPEALGSIEAPLLGIFANRDTSITPADVDAFERALGQAGVEHRIVRYDADHAFANPSGPRYHREAAEEAWEIARAFLTRYL